MRLWLPFTLCFVAGLPLAATELVLRDVGLLFELPPLSFDFDLDDGISTRSGDDSFDYGVGLELSYLRAFPAAGSSAGPFVGVAAIGQHLQYDGGTAVIHGVRGSGGLAWAPADRWLFAAGAYADIGFSRFEFPATATSADLDADGRYWLAGVEIRTAWHIDDRWSLTARIGYGIGRHDLDDGDIDLDLVQQGPFIGLGFSFRTFTAPVRLEQ